MRQRTRIMIAHDDASSYKTNNNKISRI